MFLGYIKKERYARGLGILSSFVLTILLTITFFPLQSHHDGAEATTAPSTTTLSIVSEKDAASVDLSINSSDGTFATSTSENSASFSVTTNNITGYTLTMLGSNTSGELINQTTSDTIATIAASDAADATTFATGDATKYNNKWGYLPSILNTTTSSYDSLSSGNYLSAPTSLSSATINETNCANSTTSCPNATDTYMIAIGTRADYTKPSGTYTNTFTLAATSKIVPYEINYLDTTGSDVTNLPSSEASSNTSISAFTLSSTVPQKTGYTFNKWCDGVVTHTVGENSTCTGTQYSAGDTYNFENPSATATNRVNLYAMWNVNQYDLVVTIDSGVTALELKEGSITGTAITGTTSGSTITFTNLNYGKNYYFYPTFASGKLFKSYTKTDSATNSALSSTDEENAYYTMGAGNGAVTLASKRTDGLISVGNMQNLDPSLCTDTAAIATDTRDNKEYTIARLADGKCWMTSNLNLAGGTALYSDDSDVAAANTKASGTPYYTLPNSSKSGFSSDTVAYVYNTGNETTSQTSSDNNSYYSWLAATAGGKNTSGTAVTGDGYNAAYSICPKGWRLPTATTEGVARDSGGYTGGDFYKMILAVKGVSSLSNGYYADPDFTTPTFNTTAGPGTLPNFLFAGYYYTSTFLDGGSRGFYWSSSSSSSTHAYHLYFGSTYVYSAYNLGRRNGFSVRCILDEKPIDGLTYMQDFATLTSDQKTQVLDSMSDETTYTLKDKRDQKTYNIAKLKDGQVWMTQNLRYQGDTVGSTSTTTSWIMKSATSNISADKTMTMTDLTAGNTYDAARYHVATSDQVPSGASYTAEDMGIWYNYAAASAMTITGSSNENPQTYDICPKGWRLPTYTEQSGITSYVGAYSPVVGGYYDDGTLSSTGYGGWWSSTSTGTAYRYFLRWRGSGLYIGNNWRSSGLYVRCILD